MERKCCAAAGDRVREDLDSSKFKISTVQRFNVHGRFRNLNLLTVPKLESALLWTFVKKYEMIHLSNDNHAREKVAATKAVSLRVIARDEQLAHPASAAGAALLSV